MSSLPTNWPSTARTFRAGASQKKGGVASQEFQRPQGMLVSPPWRSQHPLCRPDLYSEANIDCESQNIGIHRAIRVQPSEVWLSPAAVVATL
jgi:hypothetical protein